MLSLSLTFLFVRQISLEPPNGFAPNSQGRHAWSLILKSLNVKAKDQCSRSSGTKNNLCTPITPQQRRNGTRSLQITLFSSRRQHSVAAGGMISVACVRFMFDKTSLALVFFVCASNISGTAAPNSQGRRVWSLARMTFNVKVKGQGHQGHKMR